VRSFLLRDTPTFNIFNKLFVYFFLISLPCVLKNTINIIVIVTNAFQALGAGPDAISQYPLGLCRWQGQGMQPTAFKKNLTLSLLALGRYSKSGAPKNLTLVLWGKLDCAEKLGRPRAMISPGGPPSPQSGPGLGIFSLNNLLSMSDFS
jgi:hypothetical protein